MTNKEALIKGVLGGLPIDDFQADKALLDAGVDGTLTYDPSNQKAIDLCAIPILQSMYLQSVSEGGYNVTYNKEAIAGKLLSIGNKWELENLIPQPSIKSRSAW